METNLDLVCRLCAKEDSVCRPIPVFGEEGKKIKIAKKIRLCLPITITEEDEYPQQICLSCLNKLDTSYELYSGCLGAQKIIKRMLALVKPAERPRENIPIEQENPIFRKVASLNLNNPMGRVGSTIVKVRERKETQKSAEPRSKVQILSKKSLSNNSKAQSTIVERQETDDSNDDVIVEDDDDDYDFDVDDDGCGCEDNMDVDFSAINGEEDMELESEQALQQKPPCNSSERNHTVTYSADKTTVPQSSVVFDQLTGNSAHKVIQQSESKKRLLKPGTVNSLLQKGNNQIVKKVVIPYSLQKQTSLLENMLSQQNQIQDKNIIQTPQSKQLQTKAIADDSVPVTVQELQSKSEGTNNINKSNVKTLLLSNKPISVVFATSSQGNTKATELTPGKNLQYSAGLVARTVSENAGINPVSGHSIRCRCSSCQLSIPKSNVAATTTVSKNTTSPVVQTLEMGQISAVTARGPECSNSEDEDDPPIGIISSITSMAPSECDNTNESATPTDNTSSLTATSVTAATDSVAPVAPVATAIANNTNPGTDSNEITIDDSLDDPLNDSSTGRNVESSFCKYCEKYFPADIFIHHRTLHFRSRFFCCVACGKNFRTEVGLEHHRCDA